MNMGSKIGKHDDTPAREAGHVSPVSLTSVNAAVEGRDGESEKGTDKSPHDLWRNDDHYAGSPASSKSPSRAAKHGASGGTEELGISPEAEYSKRKRSMQHIAQNVVLEDYVRDVHQFYEIDSGDVLGSGCSGTVYTCTRISTGERYALKTLQKKNMPADAKEKYHREISMMAQLDHPNILRLHEYFENESFIYLILDLCTGGELLERLNSQYKHKYTESVARHYIKTIVGAVAYIHDHGIVHRDLKLENFLFESKSDHSELKLIDFGLSIFMDKYGLAYNSVGTPYYVAPEVMSGSYDSRCDVWSLGVIAYMLMSGRPPFFGRNDEETLTAVLHANVSFDPRYFVNVSPLAIDFIETCLNRDVTARPFAAELQNHPWFSALDESLQLALPSLDVIERLQKFANRPIFYKMCLETIAYTLLPDQVRALREQFQLLDPNNTGEITYTDMKHLMKETGLLTSEELNSLFSADFLHQNDAVEPTISYHEFIAATLTRQQVTEINMKTAFDILSRHTDHIDIESIRDLMGVDAVKLKTDPAFLAIQEHGGKINFAQFRALLAGNTLFSRGNLNRPGSKIGLESWSLPDPILPSDPNAADARGVYSADDAPLVFPEGAVIDEMHINVAINQAVASHAVSASPIRQHQSPRNSTSDSGTEEATQTYINL